MHVTCVLPSLIRYIFGLLKHIQQCHYFGIGGINTRGIVSKTGIQVFDQQLPYKACDF